jgi:hypothetical protein
MKLVIMALLLGASLAGAAGKQPAGATVDFTRGKHNAAVPAGILGAQLGWIPNGFYKDSAALHLLRRAGFTSLRLDALLQRIFTSETPDWGQIDPVLAALARAKIEPVIMVGYTPRWLQPSLSPCGAGAAYHAYPRDLKRWSELTAALVAHLDQAFPGLVRDYEIWNEPDTDAGMCVTAAAQKSRAQRYLRMFALAAGAMRAQAKLDHATIRVGAPALSRPERASSWVRVLREGTDAPPDFISYHQYGGSAAEIRAGLTWDGSHSSLSLRARTLDPRHGMAAGYLRVRQAAASLPVYLDEYNATDAYEPDCCRNHPVYAPLWNALTVQELLNVTYRSSAPVPERIMYFAAQDWFAPDGPNTAWFCLMGALNSRMDCDYVDGRPDPYPQYYVYELIAGEDYLALSRGGYLAVAASAAEPHIEVAAWSTDRGRAVLLTNSGRNARDFNLGMSDSSGFEDHATRYLLDAEHPRIGTEPLAVARAPGKATVRIRMPGYSVVGLLLRPR